MLCHDMSTIRIDLDSVPRALRALIGSVGDDLVDIIQDELSKGMAFAQQLAEDEDLRGVGDPTYYAESFEYRSNSRGGELVNTSPYADAIEYGARPHIPPVAKLAAWAVVKFGLDEAEALRVARAVIFAPPSEKSPGGIKYRGLPPRHIMMRTLAEVEANIRRRIRAYAAQHRAGNSKAAVRLRLQFGKSSKRGSIS